jgi:hypothetical protein
MRGRWLFFILLFCVLVSSTYAGNNTTTYDTNILNESRTGISDEWVSACEDGHFNTSFSDGSKGYCLEYGEEEAKTGDWFYKVDTSYYQSSNSIKLYFTEYTSHALEDKVRTQHMIWHFTDGFDGWRLNYTILDEIKLSSKVVGDEYVQVLNGTHERVWSFHVSLSPYEHRQDYFNYRFFDRLICNGTGNDSSILNDTLDKNDTNDTMNNNTNTSIQDNKSISIKDNETTNKYIGNHNKKDTHNTGNPIGLILVIIFILIIIILDKIETKKKK